MEEFIRKQYPGFSFTEADIEQIRTFGEIINLSKGSYLVKEGKINSCFYIVMEGVLRAWWNSEEKEPTLWFAIAGEPLFSTWGYVENRPSRLNIVASSSCRLLAFRREDIRTMITSSPVLCLWIQHLVELLLLITDEFLIDLSRPTAKERYLSFSNKMPQILQEVPLKEIAGYLGMTPQSLSRIRSEIVSRRNPTK
ncbi:MAG: Crp/Fnr family transcriptional regulator [Tannerellaceae bacterium]|nr:Crp/Fnr family transcriptional regulator [Tannerellaceae bacterium]